MKSRWTVILFGLIMLAPITGRAQSLPDITFTSDGLIQDGDAYNVVTITETTEPLPPFPFLITDVEMTGGSANQMFVEKLSCLDMTDGYINFLDVKSSAFIAGGHVEQLFGYVSSGMTGSTSNVHITGGQIDLIFIDVNLFLPSSVFELPPPEPPLLPVNLYGYGFEYVPDIIEPTPPSIPGYPGFPVHPGFPDVKNGLLTGHWADSTPFAIEIAGTNTYPYIKTVVVPEPASLAILGVGAVMALIRRPRKNRMPQRRHS